MVLKRIVTRNVQNHREVVIDLPPTGLIVFTGDNSNGKSVIRKTIEDIVKGDISDPHTRADLVNRKAVSCEIEMVRDDDAVLLCHIQREASATYLELTLPGKPTMRRYSSDKSYREMVELFGWHYDPITDICIQIAKNKEALLFFNTPLKTNGRVLSTALTDPKAEVTAQNLEKNIKDVQRYKELYTTKIRTYLQTLSGLVIEKVEPLEEKLAQLSRYYRNLSAIYFPTIPEIHAVPDVRLANLYVPKLPKVKYPRIYEVGCKIPNIIPIARDLKALNDKRCPTCGRRFEDHAGENTVCN